VACISSKTIKKKGGIVLCKRGGKTSKNALGGRRKL